jgi:CheY-like chemotaxis protein
MPKKILLIENDSAFAAGLTEALEANGFEVRLTGDGKEGLEFARDWAPDAIVLCVELPGMSGYLVCQKLKKDDALKALPLVLTSAEATEETFEKHRTLKARADEYLLKPYAPAALVEKLGALIGLPEPPPEETTAEAEEELVTLEEEADLEAGADGSADRELPALELESLRDEPAAAASDPSEDEDLRLLDDAFDGISSGGGIPAEEALEELGREVPDEAEAALEELEREQPVEVMEVDAAEASLPDGDEGAAPAPLGGLDADAEAALGALGGEDETLSPGLVIEAEELEPEDRPVRGPSHDILRAAGIKLLDEEERSGRGPDAVALARELGEVRELLERARGDLDHREDEVRKLEVRARELDRRVADAADEVERARAEAASAAERVRRHEEELRAAREEASRAASEAATAAAELERKLGEAVRSAEEAERRSADAEARAGAAERRAGEAEAEAGRRAQELAEAQASAAARAEALEREVEGLRTEVLVARGEAEGARNEIEKRTAELTKRVADVEATNHKNEERVVKAYQKIKADEKIREKVRKALAIAAQLLDDGLPAEAPGEKERRGAASAPRE